MALDNIRDKSRPIGLQAEDPHIYELVDMLEFCKKYDEIYIYGAAYRQQMMYKLLKNSSSICSKVKGYVVSYNDALGGKNIYLINDVIKRNNIGIILGLNDGYYRQVIPKFRKWGFEDYFVPTEWNKRTIAEQMTPRDPEYNSFEVSLVDHCNMSCQMCDHFSQLSKPWFIDTDILERDLKRMNELCEGKSAVITLLGGEPLLHPDIIKCLKISRNSFKDCPIILLTNGLLLLSLEHGNNGNIFEVCKQLNITISITRYPIQLDYEAIKEKCREYGVTLLLSSDIHSAVPIEEVKISYKHTFTLEGDKDNIFFPACHYYNHLGVVREGRYYMCPVSAHSYIFNERFGKNLEMTEMDSIDIFKVKEWKEIAEFQANRIPFCCYCDMKKWGVDSVWKPSSKKIEEYT